MADEPFLYAPHKADPICSHVNYTNWSNNLKQFRPKLR
jgi:hypothetical protein